MPHLRKTLPIIVGVRLPTRSVVVYERQSGKFLCNLYFPRSQFPAFDHPPLYMNHRILGQWIMTNCKQDLIQAGLSAQHWD